MRRAILAGLLLLAIVAASLAAGYRIRGPSQALSSAPPGASPAASLALRPGLPDPRLTPGAINPNVRPDTLADTICSPGWTATVRPPSAYTSALKIAQILEYGYADRDRSHYQEDHLVPLELGGAPRDPRNLWPQPLTAMLPDGTPIGAAKKDELEDELKRRVCDGRIELEAAQRAIAGDWVAAWIDAGRP
jgi:hypothetical protein